MPYLAVWEVEMTDSQAVIFLALPVILLACGVVTKHFRMWSAIANLPIPWFCVTLALALLVVTATAALTGRAVGSIPVGASVFVTAALTLGMLLGVLVDGHKQGDGRPWVDLSEVIGFGIMLGALFALARMTS